MMHWTRIKTTCIPRVQRKTKATCNLATVRTHLVGAIFHSGQSPNGKDVLGSFDYYQCPHDPNLTLICFAVHVSTMVWKVSTSTCVVSSIGQLCQREQESIYFVASCPSRGIEDFWEGKILCIIASFYPRGSLIITRNQWAWSNIKFGQTIDISP